MYHAPPIPLCGDPPTHARTHSYMSTHASSCRPSFHFHLRPGEIWAFGLLEGLGQLRVAICALGAVFGPPGCALPSAPALDCPMWKCHPPPYKCQGMRTRCRMAHLAAEQPCVGEGVTRLSAMAFKHCCEMGLASGTPPYHWWPVHACHAQERVGGQLSASMANGGHVSHTSPEW